MVRISSVTFLALLAATDGSTDHGRMNDVYEEMAATPVGVLGTDEQLHSAEARPVTYGWLRGSSHDEYTSALEQNSSKKLDVNEARAIGRTESPTPQAIELLQKLTDQKHKWVCSIDSIDKYEISLGLVDAGRGVREQSLAEVGECLEKSACKMKGAIRDLGAAGFSDMTVHAPGCLMPFGHIQACDVSVTGGQVSIGFTYAEKHSSKPDKKGEISVNGDKTSVQLKLGTLEAQLFPCRALQDTSEGVGSELFDIESRIAAGLRAKREAKE